MKKNIKPTSKDVFYYERLKALMAHPDGVRFRVWWHNLDKLLARAKEAQLPVPIARIERLAHLGWLQSKQGLKGSLVNLVGMNARNLAGKTSHGEAA
jgi:hypothetical protein